MKKSMLGLVAASVLSSSAFAQTGYFGADFSFISAELTDSWDNSADSDPTALRVRGGVELNENFAVEGVLGLGLQDDKVSGTPYELELDSLFGVNAVGIIPLDRTFSLFGKIGFAKVEFKDNEGDTYDDTGVSFGIGAKVNFDRRGSGMIIEYTILPDTENEEFGIDVESDMISIGAQFAF